MRNLLMGLALPLFLAGCGLPPALTVATTVVDGFSYAISGKGMTDHALSAVTTSDCALIRLLDSRELCTDYAGEEMPRVITASAPGIGSWAPVESAISPGTPIVVGGSSMDTPVPSETPMMGVSVAEYVDARPLTKPVHELARNDLLTVLGSYRDRTNAEMAALRLARLQPRIVEASAGGGTFFRIVSNVPVRQARLAGIKDAWSVNATLREGARL